MQETSAIGVMQCEAEELGNHRPWYKVRGNLVGLTLAVAAVATLLATILGPEGLIDRLFR